MGLPQLALQSCTVGIRLVCKSISSVSRVFIINKFASNFQGDASRSRMDLNNQ
jgi:hypothetical protein